MRSRPLGRTGIQVSELAFGASPLGDVFGPVTSSEATAAVREAIDLGINLFDVSPYYGLGLAEERLGAALEGHRERVVLCTKCGRYGSDVFDFSAERLQRSVEESLKRLRSDRLDILLLHDVEFAKRTQIREVALPALRKIKDQGKARFIGVSGFPLYMLRDYVDSENLDVVISYCRSNLLVNDLPRVLGPSLEATGTGLISASPLHMGVLSGTPPPPWHPAPAEVKELAATLSKQAGEALPRLALQYALRQPYAASVLVGMATPDAVRQNIKSAEAEVDEELLTKFESAIEPVRDRIWPSGLPENHDPQNR